MSYAQKDQLDRIQHTLLLTTKKFYRKRAKNADFRYIFWAAITYVTTQYFRDMLIFTKLLERSYKYLFLAFFIFHSMTQITFLYIFIKTRKELKTIKWYIFIFSNTLYFLGAGCDILCPSFILEPSFGIVFSDFV